MTQHLHAIYTYLGGKGYLQERFGYIEGEILTENMNPYCTILRVKFEILGGIQGKISYRYFSFVLPDLWLSTKVGEVYNVCYDKIDIRKDDVDPNAMLYVVRAVFR